MIRLVAVTLRLDGDLVLDGVTLHAQSGELLVIEGGRAAGKTKLLEIAGARRRPDSGEVWIADHDMTALQRESLPFVRRNIGAAFFAPRFVSGLSVLENVMLPLAARAEALGGAREAAIRALGKVGVVGLATHDPDALSTSARRLAAIARALVGSPPIVLLDDPSAALGAADSGAVLSALLGAVEKGAAAVCASSDGAFCAAAVRAGARRVRLETGRILIGLGGGVSLVSAGRSRERRTRSGAEP